MNQFPALAQVFRHAKERHSGLTRVVAGLVNRRLVNLRVTQRPLKTYPTL